MSTRKQLIAKLNLYRNQYVKDRIVKSPFPFDDDAKLVRFLSIKRKKITRYTLRYIGYNPMFGKYIGRYNEPTSLYESTSFLALKIVVLWHKRKSH
jgi:hypothetical protein